MAFPAMMETSGGYLNGYYHHPSSGSQRDVTYSCGSCGYDLNLSSSSRNTSTIGSKYGKSIKKGIMSFLYIDESRFTQVEQFQCLPYFIYKHSFGLLHRKTKLLCRKCGNRVGNAYDDSSSSYQLMLDGSDSASGSEQTHRKYDIRIRALQPAFIAESSDLGMM